VGPSAPFPIALRRGRANGFSPVDKTSTGNAQICARAYSTLECDDACETDFLGVKHALPVTIFENETCQIGNNSLAGAATRDAVEGSHDGRQARRSATRERDSRAHGQGAAAVFQHAASAQNQEGNEALEGQEIAWATEALMLGRVSRFGIFLDKR
jgi:hypothetical protein